MSIQTIIQSAVSGKTSIEQAAADLVSFAGTYAATTFEYPSAFTLGMAVEYRNHKIVGGADAIQYAAESAMFFAVQSAARTSEKPVVAGDSFTICNGAA